MVENYLKGEIEEGRVLDPITQSQVAYTLIA